MTKAKSKKSQVVIETPPTTIDHHDFKRQQFFLAYAEWKAAQAEVASISARACTDVTSMSDELMAEALERQEKAIHTLLATPCAATYQLMDKFEIVDDLVTRERIMGDSRDNYPVLALASLKIDLMNLSDIVDPRS